MTPHPKTAYVLLWFPEPTETFVFREVENLAAAGLPLTVFTLYGPRQEGLSPWMSSPSVPVERLGSRSLPALSAALLYWSFRRPGKTFRLMSRTFLRRWGGTVRAGENLWAALCGFRLARRFRELGTEHVHAPWSGGAATASWVASALAGIPFSFTARARDLYVPDRALAEKVRDAAFVRVNTERNLGYLRTLVPGGEGKLHCIYNGVDPSMGAHGRAASLEPPCRMLALGRFVAKKGYDHLLEACASLEAQGLDFTLTLAGDGPLGPALRRRAGSLGIGGRVRFPGFVPYDRVAGLFSGADIFIMPSVVDPSGDRDGIPNVIMEALLHGLPVIATDVSGIGEVVVDGETGLLVPPGDPAALAAAILDLLSDPDRARELAARGRESVLRRFDPAVSTGRILGLLDRSTPRREGALP